MRLLFLLFSLILNAQIDSLEHITANRSNTKATSCKPYVIVISADGFRYDYPQLYSTPHLDKLEKNGVKATAMMPSFPSITGPNHYSMATGLYPAHHGMVDNRFFDKNKNKPYFFGKLNDITDGSWLGGKPIWGIAENHNILTASMMWVASNSDAGGITPTYYYDYNSNISPSEKVNKVLDWLQLPMDKRPHLIHLYFPEVDANGHHHGPESDETKNSVTLIDQSVGDLMKGIDRLALKNVNIIFVSDHGMIKVDGENPLEIPAQLLDEDKVMIFNAQSLLRVMVKNPEDIQPLYNKLKANANGDYNVILTKEAPKHWNYDTDNDAFDRIGDIMLVPNAPKIFLEKNKKASAGKHGYDPTTVPEMKAVFYAIGPNFVQGKSITPFPNVDIYPLIAEIFGLTIEKTDGTIDNLKGVLVKP